MVFIEGKWVARKRRCFGSDLGLKKVHITAIYFLLLLCSLTRLIRDFNALFYFCFYAFTLKREACERHGVLVVTLILTHMPLLSFRFTILRLSSNTFGSFTILPNSVTTINLLSP